MVVVLVPVLLLALAGGSVAALRTWSPTALASWPALTGAPDGGWVGTRTGDDAARDEAARDVLRRWGEAVQAQDAGALPQLFDPQQPQWRQERVAMMEAMAGIDFSTFRMELADAVPTGTLKENLRALAERQGSHVHAVMARQVHRIDGFDTVDVSAPVRVLLVERGGRWYMAADPWTEESGHEYRIDPWRVVRVATVERPDVVVIGDTGHAQVLEDLADDAQDAVEDVAGWWSPDGWSGSVVVYATADDRLLDRWLGDDRQDVVAMSVPVWDDLDDPGADPRGLPNRVVVDLEAADLDRDLLALTVRHEVLHAATQPVTAEFMPAWVCEGVAEYFAVRSLGGLGPDLADAEDAATAEDLLYDVGVGDPVFDGLEAGEYEVELIDSWSRFYREGVIDKSYDDAWLTTAYLADTWGEQAVVDLYLHVGQAESVADAHDRLEHALGELGTDGPGLAAAAADWTQAGWDS